MLFQFGLGGESLTQVAQSEFFVFAIPWLLVFAIVYGLLEHVQIPKDKGARSMIAVVLAFFTLPLAPVIRPVIANLGAGLVMAFAGIIFFLILLELTGTHRGFFKQLKGTPYSVREKPSEKIHHRYTKTLLGAVLIIAGTIFFTSGGAELLGIRSVQLNTPLVFFVGILILAVWWMINEKGEN